MRYRLVVLSVLKPNATGNRRRSEMIHYRLTNRLKFYYEAREQILWTGFDNLIKIEYHTVL